MLGLCILEAFSGALGSSEEKQVALMRYREEEFVTQPPASLFLLSVLGTDLFLFHTSSSAEESWDYGHCLHRIGVDVLILGQAHLFVSQIAAEWLLSVDFWHF